MWWNIASKGGSKFCRYRKPFDWKIDWNGQEWVNSVSWEIQRRKSILLIRQDLLDLLKKGVPDTNQKESISGLVKRKLKFSKVESLLSLENIDFIIPYDLHSRFTSIYEDFQRILEEVLQNVEKVESFKVC